jgi:hypothetical protein
MREAKVFQIVEGTNEIQRLLIARELLKEATGQRSASVNGAAPSPALDSEGSVDAAAPSAALDSEGSPR